MTSLVVGLFLGVVAQQADVVGRDADLVAAAAASGRPRECGSASAVTGRADPTVWRLAKRPELRRFCHLIARAHARLQTDPEEAEKAARAADALLPGRAAPHVVLARIAFARGRVDDALSAFGRALDKDPRAAEQPLALHDLARVRLLAGQLDKALSSYRTLALRASLLPTRTRRAQVLLEAAHTAMAMARQAGADRATTHMEEALAYLREATRDPHHALRLDVALSLALALDRSGMAAQSDAVLAEQGDDADWTKKNPAGQGSPAYVVTAADRDALAALALERHDRTRSIEAWRRYLAAAGEGAFGDAARARLVRLEGGAKPKPRRPR